MYFAHAQVENGAEITHSTKVTTNQSGRGLGEQMKLQIDSKISKMLDKGYCTDRTVALASTPTNQLGFLRPMLAQRLERARNISLKNAKMQVKLDGHRCLITCTDGEIVAYTRQGKLITTIDHILQKLACRIPEGYTLDGELYTHGASLQTISSWIKRAQPNTMKLTYYVYDLISPSNIRYSVRKEMLDDIVPADDPFIRALKTFNYNDDEGMRKMFNTAKKSGYEGLIIRLDNYSYEDGKRSKGLLKVKSQMDEEFKVIDVVPSKDQWGICVCLTPAGKQFNVSAPGNMVEKTKILDDKDSYIGQLLTVEFACYTADMIPFHAVALRFREDV